MLKERWESFKLKFTQNKDGEPKTKNRKIENLVVFVIILIITIIMINMIWKDNKESNNTKQNTTGGSKTLASTNDNKKDTGNTNTIADTLEQKLEIILGNIQGVGKAKVLITYSQSSQTMAMYNEDTTQSNTDEEDSRRRKQKSVSKYNKERSSLPRDKWRKNSCYTKYLRT